MVEHLGAGLEVSNKCGIGASNVGGESLFMPEDEKWRTFIMAIFDQAIFDVQTGYVEAVEGEAAAWLLSTGYLWLAGLGIDIDPGVWASWVKAGCPIFREETE